MLNDSSCTAAHVASDCWGKQDIKVRSTEIESRDVRPKGELSKVFVFELVPLKSDHSLSSSDGRSSLPAMLCFENKPQ